MRMKWDHVDKALSTLTINVEAIINNNYNCFMSITLTSNPHYLLSRFLQDNTTFNIYLVFSELLILGSSEGNTEIQNWGNAKNFIGPTFLFRTDPLILAFPQMWPNGYLPYFRGDALEDCKCQLLSDEDLEGRP